MLMEVEEVAGASLWRYSSLWPPGHYTSKRTGKTTVWSGEPRHIETWEQAEWSAAAQMRALGYWDAEVTPPGTDRGIDIRSSKALAQVKREAVQTGSPQLQNLIGAAGRGYKGELWFFSGSGYARPALEYADREAVLLFKYSITGELTPVNQIAKDRYDALLAHREKRIEWKQQQRARMREKQRDKQHIRVPDPRPDDGTLWAFWPVKEQ